MTEYKEYDLYDFIYKGMQSIAGLRINQALRNGTFERADKCEICGKEYKTIAHHWNGYENPFDVWWVCHKCNAHLPHDERITKEQARARINGLKEYWTKEYIYNNPHPCAICDIKSTLGKYIRLDDQYDDEWWFVCSYCCKDLFDD